jgi:hypothetical protein
MHTAINVESFSHEVAGTVTNLDPIWNPINGKEYNYSSSF